MSSEVVLLYLPEEKLRHRVIIHLEEARFRVIPIDQQRAVAAMARSQRPAIILLDQHAPPKGGRPSFDLCRELKRSIITGPIPIIVFLAENDQVGRIVALELGADDCVTKPLHFRELVLRIKRSLARAGHVPKPKKLRPSQE